MLVRDRNPLELGSGVEHAQAYCVLRTAGAWEGVVRRVRLGLLTSLPGIRARVKLRLRCCERVQEIPAPCPDPPCPPHRHAYCVARYFSVVIFVNWHRVVLAQ